MTHSCVSAAVLIGGQSRRMGVPKALLRLADEDETLIERVVPTLRDVASEIVLVGTPSWRLPDSLVGCRQVVDRGTSAADGVIAALETAGNRFCIVVACDMPFLDVDLLRRMASEAQREARGVVAADARGRHPLHAVWDGHRLPELQAAVERGERSLGTLAQIAGMATLDLEATGQFDRGRWSVFNVNTPDDLAIARAHASGGA